MFNLPGGFQPTDEWARGTQGMSLANYYAKNPGAQDAWNNSPSQQQARIDKQVSDQNNQFNSMVTAGKNDITDYLGRYKADTGNAVNEASSYYHLPEQTSIVNSLNSRILNLQGNGGNNGAAASGGVGGFASNDQVGTALSRNLLPQYSAAAGNLNTSSTLAQARTAQNLAPDVSEGTLLNERLAREMTGFTAQQQTVMQGLIAKLQSGTTLTTTEMNNANELAKAQLAYQQAVDTVKQQQQAYVLDPTQTYYTPANGYKYSPTLK